MAKSIDVSMKACGRLIVAALLPTLSPPVQAQMTSEPIPSSELSAKCGLDPDIMAGVDRYFLQGRPFVIYRNGHYCWRSGGATAVLHLTPVR